MQEPQPFGTNFTEEKIEPGRIAARPGEVRDETYSCWVFGDAEDDRDRRGSSFGRKRSRGVAGRGDNVHAASDEVRHQRRQATVLSFKPMVLDRYVLTLDIAGVTEAGAERRRVSRHATGRTGVYDPDDRHRRLLRARRDRPRRRRAAEQRDEFAPFHHSIISSARVSSVAGS